MRRFSLLLLCLLALQFLAVKAIAQVSAAENEANQFAKEAAELVSEGKFQAAAEKFSFASRLAPKNVDYQLGFAHAKFFLKEFQEAMAICRPLMVRKRPVMRAFQIFGSCQDGQGQSYEALQTFREGLKIFPNAGVLYMEMGIVEFGRHRDAAALQCWEQGIDAEPTFASNYLFAAQRLFAIGDYAWAEIYAELFLNLERTGNRVPAMSKLLMATYESARVYSYETYFSWEFYQVGDTNAGTLAPEPRYQHLLDSAFANIFVDSNSQISITRLIETRRFVCFWMQEMAPKNPVSGLMEWQKLLTTFGQFEAYNYWLLYDALEEEFKQWFAQNKENFEEFEHWFSQNSILKYLKRPIVRPESQTQGNRKK